MSEVVITTIENVFLIIICLFCIYGVFTCRKHTRTIPGADLLLVGFLFFGVYALFALGAVGFTGSFFDSVTRVGTLNAKSYMYFLSMAARLGLILVIIGLFRMGKNLKA